MVELRAGYLFAKATDLLGVSNNDLRPLANCFALWGRRANDNLYRPINPLNWLEVRDAQSSEIIDKSDNVSWFDVRFIPPICAPNVHEFVGGLEFHVAFWRVILSDPEVGAAYNAALIAVPCLGRFVRLLHLFGPDEMLRISESAFLIKRCSRHLHDACADLEKKEISLGRYPNLVGGRTRQLLSLLTTGRILADGFYRSDTSQRIGIDRALWARAEYAIDLRKGDFVNVETGETEWRSIVLRAPKFNVAEAEECDAPAAASLRPTMERTRGRGVNRNRLTQKAIEAQKCLKMAFPHGVPTKEEVSNGEVWRRTADTDHFKKLKKSDQPGRDTVFREAGRRSRQK